MILSLRSGLLELCEAYPAALVSKYALLNPIAPRATSIPCIRCRRQTPTCSADFSTI